MYLSAGAVCTRLLMPLLPKDKITSAYKLAATTAAKIHWPPSGGFPWHARSETPGCSGGRYVDSGFLLLAERFWLR